MAKKLLRRSSSCTPGGPLHRSARARPGDYGIASLYRIGVVYQHLAKEMFATPCPKRPRRGSVHDLRGRRLQEKAFRSRKSDRGVRQGTGQGYELGCTTNGSPRRRMPLKAYERSGSRSAPVRPHRQRGDLRSAKARGGRPMTRRVVIFVIPVAMSDCGIEAAAEAGGRGQGRGQDRCHRRRRRPSQDAGRRAAGAAGNWTRGSARLYAEAARLDSQEQRGQGE